MKESAETANNDAKTAANQRGDGNKKHADNKNSDAKPDAPAISSQKEYGGRSGPEPTRYGDWEKNGIISDF